MREPAGGEARSRMAGPVGAGPAGLPVLGEVPAALWRAVQEGQPVGLTRDGLLAVVDLDSWVEVEELLEESGDEEPWLAPVMRLGPGARAHGSRPFQNTSGLRCRRHG